MVDLEELREYQEATGTGKDMFEELDYWLAKSSEEQLREYQKRTLHVVGEEPDVARMVNFILRTGNDLGNEMIHAILTDPEGT